MASDTGLACTQDATGSEGPKGPKGPIGANRGIIRNFRILGILPVSGKIGQIQGTGGIPMDSGCDSMPNYGVKTKNGFTGA